MARRLHRFRRLFTAALLAALIVITLTWPIAAGAVAPVPRCLGRPGAIIGRGMIHGTAHADVIVASGGADHIFGGGGNDRICAGGGSDTIPSWPAYLRA